MSLDVVLRGGDVVDGTGAARRRADVGIKDGRIVAIGTVDEPAAREIDVTGRVVAPGFVDVHTHYDVQLLWDPYATPSPLHGVTTVIGGNCGVSIAPLAPGDDYVLRMMAHVEGMPLDSVLAGPAWDWSTFGEYLDAMEGKLGVNAGFLVGHSTIRRLVMGAQAVGNTATPEQVDAMVAVMHEALAAGALGFSSAMGDVEFDGDGNPAPSRAAAPEEFFALAGACREHEGTILEFIPAMGEISEARMDLMTGMSLAAGRPLNWNLLGSFSSTEVFEQQLTASDHPRARRRGRGAHGPRRAPAPRVDVDAHAAALEGRRRPARGRTPRRTRGSRAARRDQRRHRCGEGVPLGAHDPGAARVRGWAAPGPDGGRRGGRARG